MKKKLGVIAAIAICLALMVAYGTVAFFTDDVTVHNVITTGDIQIELQEWKVPDKEPFEDVDGVMPGMAVDKIVQVKNTGSQPAWVRILLTKTIHLADGVDGEVDLDLVTYDLDDEHWTEKDGIYYYNDILAPGERTEPLFTKVTFSPEMGNLYQGSRAEITVLAQATQVANNGETALEADGWPDIAMDDDNAAEEGGATE